MKRMILLFLFAWLLHVDGWAQLSNVTNGYVGNTFSGGDNKWVQNYANEVDVAPDGTLVTGSEWDEAGRNVGIFKDGQPVAYLKQYNGAGGHSCWGWGTATKAIAIDDNYLYVNNCQGDLLRFNRSNNYAYVDQVPTGGAEGMTFSAGSLYLVKANGLVEKRSTASIGTVSLSFTVTGGYDVAVDAAGNIWVLTTNKEVLKYNASGTYTNTKIAAQPGWQPSAVNYDAYNNLLLVPDNGPHRQVKKFNTSGAQVATFGDTGGISAGTKGMVGDLRFWDIAGSGTDAGGNIYVALNENAVSLRKFNASGAKQWEVVGMMFTDVAGIDPASDGNDIYGVNEHMKFDYASQQWSLISITNDKITYPNDPRNVVHGTSITSALVRRVNGNLLMFTAGMYAGGFDVYRFEGETAVHCQAISGVGWSGLPDKNGNVWYENGGKIKRIPLTGFSGGCPVFGATVDVTASLPSPMTGVERVEYNADADVMYLAGWTSANPNRDNNWGLIGSTIARYPNWSTGNRTASHTAVMPKDVEGFYPKAMSVAGEYVFVGTSRDRGKVYVFNGATLASTGSIAPPTNMGEIGWLDIPHAVQAFKKSDGKYLVLVEDNSKGKNILYQWCPAGTCGGSTPPPNTSGIYEAEAAENILADGAQRQPTLVNWMGSVTFPNVGAAAGAHTLTIHYFNGDTQARTLNVSVNGGTATAVSCPPSGGWATVATVTATISLAAGTNPLKISGGTGGGPDLDKIGVSASGFSGYYKLTAKCSNKVLEVANASTQNGANVQQWTFGGGNHQLWKLESTGDGYYRLIAKHSGKALEVAKSSAADGANIQQWGYGGGNNQQWKIESTGDGYHRLVARHSGKVLDVNGAGTADGTNVHQWTWNGGDAQKWKIDFSSAARLAKEAEVQALKVYPNPADDRLNIHLPAGVSGAARIIITDVLFRTVKSFTAPLKPGADPLRLPINDLRGGVYVVRVEAAGVLYQQKIVVRQ